MVGITIERYVPIPRLMESIKNSNTRLEPMIFWALVEIRARGQYLTSASEVERTINQYLTDDHSKVEPTNIARKLRSKTMQDKPWLNTQRTGIGDKKMYGVFDDWAVYWRNIFDEESPSLP